jgi:hypothetical protein
LAFAVTSPGAFDGVPSSCTNSDRVGGKSVTNIGGVEWGQSVALDDSGTVLALGQPIFRPDPLDGDAQSSGAINITGLFGTVEAKAISWDHHEAAVLHRIIFVDGLTSLQQGGVPCAFERKRACS